MPPARRLLTAVLAGALVTGLAACEQPDAAAPAPAAAVDLGFTPPPDDGSSWAPAPVEVGDGLTAVAGTFGDEYRLHTADGDVTFLPGVDLGATTPGHQPGELAIDAATYRRWFDLMGRMGIRVVRTYTIHPPAFYTELRAYDLAHEDAPIYLVAGVYLPDESYVASQDLYAAGATAAFDAELTDAVAAVHGDLTRPDTPGRAEGTWDADVSPWTAGWIAGVEWDPGATVASDVRNADAPAVRGRWFTSAPDATPTERWLAARLETLAAAQVARGAVAPVAFVNWPTTDPLRHPAEPLASEDLAQIDANAVRPTAAWPGGYFASYHAYPYYPDFLRLEPGLAQAGDGDPWAGYLRALQAHHQGLPVMVSEFGVPSSLGSAHPGTRGRDQGGHSEQEAVATDAAMLRTLHDLGLAGGLLFSWTDEWFKATWNTVPRQLPAERRSLWHDALTNEQWFGLLAQDPLPAEGAAPTRLEGGDTVGTDPGWVTLRGLPAGRPFLLAFDVVPGGARTLPGGAADRTADVVVGVDPGSRTARVMVRRALDPVPLDSPGRLPARGSGDWVAAQLTTGRAMTLPATGEQVPAELFDVGELLAGTWDPADPAYDSRATVRFADGSTALRLPWSLLGVADPSSRQALVPRADGTAGTAEVVGIGVALVTGGVREELGSFSWEGWDAVRSRERVKAGVQAWVDALAEVSR